MKGWPTHVNPAEERQQLEPFESVLGRDETRGARTRSRREVDGVHSRLPGVAHECT